MSVLSSRGYDGASLNELADSSGLKKASLYHRFPGGKKDIAIAVLNFVNVWIDKNIVKRLKDKKLTPSVRLNQTLSSLDELYQGGRLTCILRALSMDRGQDLFGNELLSAANDWVDAFTILGIDVGMNEGDARKTAIDVLTKVQGSLVVCKLLDDMSVFQSALNDIKILYKEH